MTPDRLGGSERDVDLVLVTGAGASRSFGAGRTFPLMAEWAEAILEKVTTKATWAHRQMLGLERGMDGPTFERQLGLFLRHAEAFRTTETLLKPSLELQMAPQQVKMHLQSGGTVLEEWHRITAFALDELLELLNETLSEEFAIGVNDRSATQAYRWLFERLGITMASSIVYATTNYDVVGETALRQLGYLVDWGRPAQLASTSPDEPLRVERLIEVLPRNVPVLHLHGRIGWYQRDGQVRDFTVSTTYNKAWGTPLVMWPDDDKGTATYQAAPVINDLWRQFREVLRRARKVLVLGHSLNDSFLVEALRDNVPPERLAVTVFTPAGARPTAPDSEVGRIKSLVGEATVVPMEFAEQESGVHILADWTNRVAKYV